MNKLIGTKLAPNKIPELLGKDVFLQTYFNRRGPLSVKVIYRSGGAQYLQNNGAWMPSIWTNKNGQKSSLQALCHLDCLIVGVVD